MLVSVISCSAKSSSNTPPSPSGRTRAAAAIDPRADTLAVDPNLDHGDFKSLARREVFVRSAAADEEHRLVGDEDEPPSGRVDAFAGVANRKRRAAAEHELADFRRVANRGEKARIAAFLQRRLHRGLVELRRDAAQPHFDACRRQRPWRSSPGPCR